MTYREAKELAARINQHDTTHATVVRILPAHLDFVKEGDNGWDVLVRVSQEESLS